MKKKILMTFMSALIALSMSVSTMADVVNSISYNEVTQQNLTKLSLSEADKLKIKKVFINAALAGEYSVSLSKLGISEELYDSAQEYVDNIIWYEPDLYCVYNVMIIPNFIVFISYKGEYIKTDGSINIAKAKSDWYLLQKELNDGKWKQALVERFERRIEYHYETNHSGGIEIDSLGFAMEIRDICKRVKIDEVREFIGKNIVSNPEYYFLICRFYPFENEEFIFIDLKSQYINEDNSIDRLQAIRDGYELEERLFSINVEDTEKMTDIEKVLAIHEWVVRECEYDYKNYLNGTIPDISYNEDGVIEKGLAVCSGYTCAIDFLLKRLGVESYYTRSADMCHAWNIVKIGNSYYHLDATWDDWGKDERNEGAFYHTYFLKSDAEMEKLRHYGWEADITCTDSGSFSNYIFGGSNAGYITAFNYFDGFWYYRSGNIIYKSKVDGTQKTEFKSFDEDIINTYIYKDSMYLATKTRVYKIDMRNTTDVKEIFNIKNDSSMSNGIDEFVIKQDKIKIDSGAYSKTISIKLNDSTIKLEKTRADMQEGETIKLQASYSSPYSSKVKWSSSNPLAVTVDDTGNVTALGGGTAVIVASVDGITTECTITSQALYTYGDINDDGTIDTQDAVLIRKYLAGYKGLDINTDACDVNGDGDVTSADVVLLLKKLAGYNVMLGK